MEECPLDFFFDKVSFEDTAIMLSLSPLFAMGRYKDVVESYEQAGSRMNKSNKATSSEGHLAMCYG